MSGLVETILNRLGPSSLVMLDKLGYPDEESPLFSTELQNCMDAANEVQMRQSAREMDSLAELLRLKSHRTKSLLDKYTKQFKLLEITETVNSHEKKMSAYIRQIEILEEQLSLLLRKAGGIGADQFFWETNEMHKAIQDFEIKIKALLDKHKVYEGFPADITEAKHCVSDLKEKILKKQEKFECYLYGKR